MIFAYEKGPIYFFSKKIEILLAIDFEFLHAIIDCTAAEKVIKFWILQALDAFC
jgi:hypothetical protein